jgi:hypothetical protein
VNTPWPLAVLCVLSLAALAMLVRAVLRLLRNSRLGELPLQERQEVAFPAAGRVVLCMEGPRFTPRFRKLHFELSLPGGTPVAGRRVVFRTVTAGIRWARVTLRSFELPYAGRYELRIAGLSAADAGAPAHRVVFMHPHLARSLLLVVGITLASALAVASLVFLLLSFVSEAVAIDPGRASGFMTVDGERVALREAYALQHAGHDGGSEFSPELRLVLADREIPQASLAGPAPLPLLELARTGQVRGLLIRLDPGDSDTLLLTPLLPPGPAAAAASDRPVTRASGRVLRNLRLSTQRVSGDLECPPAADLQCSVHFSAPLFTEY